MSNDTLERDLRAAFTARADATQFHEEPPDLAVADLTTARARRRPVAVALAAAAAVAVAVAAIGVIARDDADPNDDGVAVTETSTPEVAPRDMSIGAALNHPMTFANGEPVGYSLPGVPADATHAALQCTAGHLEADSYVCTEVSGTFVSTTRNEFVATNNGSNAANAQGLEPDGGTRVDVGGHPAVIAHYATKDAAIAGGVPALVGGGSEVPIATATWLVAPNVRVNVQATDRDDTAMIALLESLILAPLTTENLPLAVVGSDYNAIVLTANDDGSLCYSQASFGDCSPVGDTGDAIGFPEGLYIGRPYGWARADVDRITVTAPDGGWSDVTLSEVVDDAGHRIWSADTDLTDVMATESVPLTITAYDAAGTQIGQTVMDGGRPSGFPSDG